ncbi:C4-type zinc ribbon domain-containing protein [Haliscomenobacter sp.]|uniref:zinc ribbon domain-containing protein n=1 Tax=Haliscomenobacter sp. TaxID=2717303 RepID=UPI0033652896
MANEITVAEKLKTLYQLQLIDAQIGEIEVLKGELPMEVSDLEDDIVGLETRLEKTVNSVKELQTTMSRYVANIKEAEALKIKYKTQLDNVKNNREYEALTKELEMQDLDIQLDEKRIKQSKMDIAKQEESQANTEERLNKKKTDLEAKQVELNEIISKTEHEENALRSESNAAREHIEERLIKAYDKIRSSYRNGLAVVTVQRDSCGGCFNKIPPQVQLEISMRKKIIACEHCGRILVDDLILTGDKIAEHAEVGA